MSGKVCPYEHCNKSFSTSYNLSKHVKVVHLKIKSFRCPRCGRDFGYKHTLRNHLSLHVKLADQCAPSVLSTIIFLTGVLTRTFDCNCSSLTEY